MKKRMIADTEVHLEPTERYVQVNEMTEQNSDEVWQQLCEQYSGFEAFFCFHGSAIPVAFLCEIGAERVDHCLDMRLRPAGFAQKELPSFIPVTEANFAAFAEFHDRRNPGMYWTSARLREETRWCILLSQSETEIDGYIMVSMWNPQQAEIFMVEAAEAELCENLIVAAAAQAFAAGKSEVQYMPDVGTQEQEIAAALGFQSVGNYQGYRIRVP